MSISGLRATALLLCGFAGGAALFAAWRCDLTFDEPFHLRWSERLLETGETERASQERFNSKTPATLPNVIARKVAQGWGVKDARALRLAARLPTVVWLLALLAGSLALAGRLAGERAALIAACALGLDPNLIAHGSLTTVDCLYALTTLLTLWAAASFAHAPTARRGGRLGLMLGAAFATKFTAFLLVAGVALAVVAVPPAATQARRRAAGLWAGLAAAAIAALLVLDFAYLGIGDWRPLREIPLQSNPLHAVAAAVPGLRLPIPEAFLTGLDRSLGSERGWGPIVLLGHAYPGGVPYYFLVCWALKTPLLLAAAQLLGLGMVLRTPDLRRHPALRFLALNLLLTLGYFSFAFKTQIGYRFVLMCVPLAWIVAAAGLARLEGPRWAAAWGLALALALAENAAYLGNPLSFTNAAVWPKRQAFPLLADSNLDWGHTDDKISAWVDAAGIPEARLDPVHLLPGPNVLSVNAAAGVYDFERHRWLREHVDPSAHFGHSHLRFDVDDETYSAFMNQERRLLPNPAVTGLCPESLDYQTLQPGGQLGFGRDTAPLPNRVWVLCVKARLEVDLGYRVRSGGLHVGYLAPDRRCRTELLTEDRVAWRRLAPGSHLLCALEAPNRRASLPYRQEGAWIVRGHAAELSFRPMAAEDGAVLIPRDAPAR